MQRSTKNLLGWAAVAGAAALVGRAAVRRYHRLDLRNRLVLITGGSRGLGLLLAREFAWHGAKLVICARDARELERARNMLSEVAAEIVTVRCDVTRREQVQEMIERVTSEHGFIDVVVNNAGIIQMGPVDSMTLADYDEAMQTHFYGPLHVIEAVLPQMRHRRQGRIVNIASIGGLVSVPHLLPYCASKFALVGYSLGLRSELAKSGIRVTTVCPSLMRTGSPRNAWFKGQHRAEYAWFKTSGSLPIASMNADRAAHRIVDACRHGDGLVVLGTPGKLASTLSALFPSLAADVLSAVNRLLPSPGGIGQSRARGFESESPLTESWLTELTQRAAARNNEE